MSLAETAIQLRREDCLMSPTSSLLSELFCCKYYHSRAYSHRWSLPGGEMLIKQPSSYRTFCTSTLGSCPGPSTILQGGLRQLNVRVGKKEGADGCALVEENPPWTLGQCPLDGKEKTFGCCVEQPQLQARSWSYVLPIPWWGAVVLFVLIKCLALWVEINSCYRFERPGAPGQSCTGQISPAAPSNLRAR